MTNAQQIKNHSLGNDEGKMITPIPEGAYYKTLADGVLNDCEKIWEYRDEQGRLLYVVCRFRDKNGNKKDLPLTYRQDKNGNFFWAWKGLDTPRPLYGQNRLAKNPNASVIVCEGEKATDAATSLFPDHVAVTSPNGANSAHKADWTPLAGRDVTIWPDNDKPGRRYAESAVQLAKKAGAKSVRIVTVPDDFPEKWDLADELPSNRTRDDLKNLLDNAESVTDPLENIVERVKNNPGEAYKPSVQDALIALQSEDYSAYINLRSQLRKAGVGVMRLDKAVEERCIEQDESPQKPDHLDLAIEVINNIGADNLLATAAHIWMWRETGVWRSVADRELKKEVQRTLEQDGHAVTRGLVDAVTDVLITEIYAPEHQWNPDSDAVNVMNGELYRNGAEWELQPHCREHYRTTQIPVVYDPQATCPRFTQFLQEIFLNDPDYAEKAWALLEMIGYTLVSHADFEKFILLVGSGANGKSVVMDVVRALAGSENVAAVSPTQFGNRFQRAHLHLKLANLVTEIAEGGEIADAELKAITSGELTTAEHKGKNPFDFRPFCTCWFGTNHMPHTRDFSDALFRRALVIPFNRTFKAGVDADPDLKAKLIDELPGIMNLALYAFGEVIKRGTFTEPPSCLAAKQEWRMEADQAAQFVEERCVLDASGTIESSALYGTYISWASAAGISRRLNKKNFTQRLVRLGCSTCKGTGGKRMIAGVRILPWQ